MDKPSLKILLSFFEITLIFSGIIFVCYLALGQILEVSGDSMYPLVHDKDRILAEKVSAKFSKFQRGEIIVFTSVEGGDSLIIKRIIGLPKDKVAINGGHVFVNGQIITEPYLKTGDSTQGAKFLPETESVTVPEGQYFVMGDNRAKSIDSRTWGTLPTEKILGRAIMIYKPLNRIQFLLK